MYRSDVLSTHTLEGPAERVSDRPLRAVLPSWARASLGPLAVAVAYFLGAQLGFVLRFPPATTSILWPPNAILTAALLLTPPRRWWMFLLAAFPAHLAVQLPVGWPVGLILTLFATNCLEAVIGAGLVHRLSDAPDRFDTLRRAALFVAAVVLAAVLVSGFVDATAVAVLAGRALLARVADAALLEHRHRAGPGPGRRDPRPVALAAARAPSSRRAVEAILAFPPARPRGLRRSSPVPSRGRAVSLGLVGAVVPVLLLPVLLWAATRFGAAGASFAMLTTALLAFVAATAGHGSPTAVEATREVRGLQAFLLVAGIPLFALGALMDERRSTEAALEERLRFEALLSRISGAFVHLPSNAMDCRLRGPDPPGGRVLGARLRPPLPPVGRPTSA